MRHPTEGVLRRLLDEPAGVADDDRRHVADCSTCLRELAAARTEAALVGAALTADAGPEVDVAAAWQRLSAAAPAPRAVRPPARTSRPLAARSAGLLRRPAAAAFAVALVLTGAGTAAANDWLQVFRTEQVAPVGITTADLVALPDLEAYGELEVTEEPSVRSVPAEVAARQSGVDVPQVRDLPAGIQEGPVHQVGSKASATFTFSAERAAQAAAEAGEPLPAPPPGVDGARLRLEAGPGVATIWSSASGAPALIVGRAVAPTAFSSSGVPFEVLRDYLLALPGLPDDVAAQLRTFAADGSTLPLPVPADQVTTTTADVDGARATVLATRDRTLGAVVWVDEGLVTVVAGALSTEELLTVARELG